MRSLEKRLLRLEKKIKSKYNHSGAFIIFINGGVFEIQSEADKGKFFYSKEELDEYVWTTYEAEKYVFLNFDMDLLKKKSDYSL